MTEPQQGRTALYRLYDESGRLLYVGITRNPEARFAQHRADKPWWDMVARKDIEWYDKRVNALAAEEIAIKVKDPMFNHDHSRHHRPVLTVPVELTMAQRDGLDMLMRIICPIVSNGAEYTRADMLTIMLDRELSARGLYGDRRCLHAWMTWPDEVNVRPGDGICPCGNAILPDGHWPRSEQAEGPPP